MKGKLGSLFLKVLILVVMSLAFVVDRNNKSFVMLILVFNDACVVLVDRYCHRNVQLSQSCHREEVSFNLHPPLHSILPDVNKFIPL